MKRLCFCLLSALSLLLTVPAPAQSDTYTRFEKVWNDVNANYAYFEYKGVDWEAVRKTYAPKFARKLSSKKEAALLGEMLQTLRDGHVALYSSRGYFRYDKWVKSDESYQLDTLFDQIILDEPSMTVVRSRDALLYIRIPDLDEPTAGLDRVWTAMAGAKGIVVDLRDNGGGNEAYARAFVEGFVPDTVVYKTYRFTTGEGRNQFKPWQKATLKPLHAAEVKAPIIVLINENCFSSCEAFVLMFKAIPGTTVFGRTTGGSTGFPKTFQLDNGWSFTVSTWQEADPQGRLIEDHGVPPDIRVEGNAMLNAAISLLRNQGK